MLARSAKLITSASASLRRAMTTSSPSGSSSGSSMTTGVTVGLPIGVAIGSILGYQMVSNTGDRVAHARAADTPPPPPPPHAVPPPPPTFKGQSTAANVTTTGEQVGRAAEGIARETTSRIAGTVEEKAKEAKAEASGLLERGKEEINNLIQAGKEAVENLVRPGDAPPPPPGPGGPPNPAETPEGRAWRAEIAGHPREEAEREAAARDRERLRRDRFAREADEEERDYRSGRWRDRMRRGSREARDSWQNEKDRLERERDLYNERLEALEHELEYEREERRKHGWSATSSGVGRLLGIGSGGVPRNSPLRSFTEHYTERHAYASNRERTQDAAHYVQFHTIPGSSPGLLQCAALFDNDSEQARLIGVEYVISADVYQRLPRDEQKLWRVHTTRDTIVPALKGKEARDELAGLADLKREPIAYGKTWHTWQVDRGDFVPYGVPQLMESLGAERQSVHDEIASHYHPSQFTRVDEIRAA